VRRRRRKLRISVGVPVLLLVFGLHAAQQRWSEYKRWRRRVHRQQPSTEMVAKQFSRHLHA
jgi:hypothetical protein